MTETAGSLLKDLRNRSGETQQEIAERVGVHCDTWGRYETGKLPCPADVLQRAERELQAPGLVIQYLRLLDTAFDSLPKVVDKPLTMAQLAIHVELEDVLKMQRAADKALCDDMIAADEESEMWRYCSEISEAIDALATMRCALLRCLQQKNSPQQSTERHR